MAMLRWDEDQLAAYHRTRQSRAEAVSEAKQHTEDAPRSKYRNKKVTIDGKKFDSKAEGARYVQLKRMVNAGLITDLQCQPAFDLVVNGQKITRYTADFEYRDGESRRVVEDVKGVRTRDYVLRRKLMKAVLGITVQEIKVERRTNARKP